MCDRMSYVFGYICNECFEELVQWLLSGNYNISDFMQSSKHRNNLFNEKRIRAVLEEEFPIME